MGSAFRQQRRGQRQRQNGIIVDVQRYILKKLSGKATLESSLLPEALAGWPSTAD